jgi:hypothetical protein
MYSITKFSTATSSCVQHTRASVHTRVQPYGVVSLENVHEISRGCHNFTCNFIKTLVWRLVFSQVVENRVERRSRIFLGPGDNFCRILTHNSYDEKKISRRRHHFLKSFETSFF